MPSKTLIAAANAFHARGKLHTFDIWGADSLSVDIPAVLAPGSSHIVPKSWQALGGRIFTTDNLFEVEDLPSRIGVIGLDAIGAEIAQALARLGIEIHAFDGADQMAGISDHKVAVKLRKSLEKEFAIHLGVEVDLASATDGIEIR